MPRFIALLFSALLAGNLSAATVEATEPPLKTITLSTSLTAKPMHERGIPSVNQLYRSFEALGYRLEVVFHPSLRSLTLANTGLVDGELGRPAAIAYQYSNLLKSDLAFSRIEAGVYTLGDRATKSWRSPDIKVLGLGRGSIFLSSAMQTELQNARLQLTSSADQGLQMLNAGRLDAMLLSRMEFEALSLQRPRLTKKLIKLPPELPTVPIYIYLHKRHKDLLPDLTEQLRRDFPLQGIAD